MAPLPTPQLLLAAFCLATLPVGAPAQTIPDPQIDLTAIGRLATRPARAITGSNWSIGCEVLDRDLANYEHYKSYLGPLGAKHARLQAGWAKTEKTKGSYDWTWLDAVVDDVRRQGVQPWMQFSYGNPIYPGGGGPTLGDGIPKSPEALAAWDNWVRGTVRRFRDRVNAWEVWNEPDGAAAQKMFTVEEYARLFVRTAEIIRAEQPRAQIYALSLSSSAPYLEAFLRLMQSWGKLALFDAITFHGYPKNPDETRLEGLRKVLEKLRLDIPLRQGETGAPSTTGTSGALGNFPGSELTQAKWILRRALAFHGHDVPFSLFLLMEFDYAGQPHTGINSKGLLKTNPDKTVAYAKPSYRAAQHLFSLFDDSWGRIRDFAVRAETPEKLAAYAFRHRESGQELVVTWASAAMPTESLATAPVDLELPGLNIAEPVVADLRTGVVYRVPPDCVVRAPGAPLRIRRVPIYDSPIVVAERSALRMQP